MSFHVKNVSISFSSLGNLHSDIISFEVAAAGFEKITIADKYVFGNRRDTDKLSVSGAFTIQRLQQEWIDHYKLNENRIGAVSFFESSIDEFSSSPDPSLIVFNVFVQDALYENIKNAIYNKMQVIKFSCHFEGLRFGYEPDGSHQIWDLDESKEKKFGLPLADCFVTSFHIKFGDGQFN
jgi:hypothetical protein